MSDLTIYQDQIDRIDEEILHLFEKRMELVEESTGFKIKIGHEVLDDNPERKEEEFVSKVHSKYNATGAGQLIRQIMAIERKRQYQMINKYGSEDRPPAVEFECRDRIPFENATVVFQGVRGAYSYAAMNAFFGEDIKSFHVKTWKDAADAVLDGRADYAVLPIENSTAGVVADIYDLLAENDLYIMGEQVIRVDHVLLGLPGTELSDITDIYSHPQGLAQCNDYILSHPQWTTHQTENTAVSAQKVVNEANPSHAAIASREAGKLYGLDILAENICLNKKNVTRFIIIGSRAVYLKNAGRVSICFELPHHVGSLYEMLSHIMYNSLNMTRIESRPIPGKTWEYRFFIDFEGNLNSSSVKTALRGIEEEAGMFKILGNY